MMGILYAVFTVIGCFPINLVFQIIYWMKMVNYKNELMASGRGGALEDDYDDDHPRRPRRRRDEDDEEDLDDRRRRDDD
jgi:hypothetical protein